MTDEGGDATLGEGAGLLWGKTAQHGGTGWHALACHMIDAAEAAGWVWDEFLSPVTRERIDTVARDVPGGGRVLLQWLAAMHDLGKATPAFQAQNELRCEAVRSAGLAVSAGPAISKFSHARLSGRLLWELMRAVGWSPKAASWAALTEAGHHGVFPAENWLDLCPYDWEIGTGAWEVTRDQIVGLVCAHIGIHGCSLPPVPAPDLPLQVVLSGAVILADWIASNEGLFIYVGEWRDGYPALAARRRAGIAAELGFRDRWQPDPDAPKMGATSLYTVRFPFIKEPRPIQVAAYSLAAEFGPGLLLIEGRMGEGKTEAALVAAEVMAALGGADGLFTGLPSKATANQAFGRTKNWLDPQPGWQVITLAHSGARRHQEFKGMLAAGIGVDEEDDCGVAASQWLTGSKKALLSPVTVGTIDQLLLAGVSSRHVSLRHLGLVGKVVIIDEVHACDAYMSEILGLVLRWLGAARVPVILLSATLASSQRQSLLDAYAGTGVVMDPKASGYPRLSWVPAPARSDGRARRDARQSVGVVAQTRTTTTESRPDVAVTMVEELGCDLLPAKAAELVTDGGCALVVRNAVGRAQETYRELQRTSPGVDVMLVHARFTVADRRDREGRLEEMFGRGRPRPARPHVTVGTQVLEQSLDCDWDALLSDLCPIDLLLQRLGRVHRHERARDSRGRMKEPKLFVGGRMTASGAPPTLPRGSSVVYTDHLLWRTEAALLGRHALQIPQDIPVLVDLVYGEDELGPRGWQDAMAAAAERAGKARRDRQAQAAGIILPEPDGGATLAHIHRHSVGDARDEAEGSDLVQGHVRIGPPTIEVVLLRADGTDTAATVSGYGSHTTIPLGRSPSQKEAEAALDQIVRLPAQLTPSAVKRAAPVPAWTRVASLARVPVLILPKDGSALRLGPFECSYSPDLGLEVTSA